MSAIGESLTYSPSVPSAMNRNTKSSASSSSAPSSSTLSSSAPRRNASSSATASVSRNRSIPASASATQTPFCASSSFALANRSVSSSSSTSSDGSGGSLCDSRPPFAPFPGSAPSSLRASGFPSCSVGGTYTQFGSNVTAPHQSPKSLPSKSRSSRSSHRRRRLRPTWTHTGRRDSDSGLSDQSHSSSTAGRSQSATDLEICGGKVWSHVRAWLRKHGEGAWVPKFEFAKRFPDVPGFLKLREEDLRAFPGTTVLERKSLLDKIRTLSATLQFQSLKETVMKFYKGRVPAHEEEETLKFIARRSCDEMLCSQLGELLFSATDTANPRIFARILVLVQYCVLHGGGIGIPQTFFSKRSLAKLDNCATWPIARRETFITMALKHGSFRSGNLEDCINKWEENSAALAKMKDRLLSSWIAFKRAEQAIVRDLDSITFDGSITVAKLYWLLHTKGLAIDLGVLKRMMRSVSSGNSTAYSKFEVLTLAWHHGWHLQWILAKDSEELTSRSRSSEESKEGDGTHPGIANASCSSSSSSRATSSAAVGEGPPPPPLGAKSPSSSSSRISVAPPTAVLAGEVPRMSALPGAGARTSAREQSTAASSSSTSRSSMSFDPSRRTVEMLRNELLEHDSKTARTLEFLQDADLLDLPEEKMNALCEKLNSAGSIVGASVLTRAWTRHRSGGDKRPRSAIEGESEDASASSRTPKRQKTARDSPPDSKADAMADTADDESSNVRPPDSEAAAIADAADVLSPKEMPTDSKAAAMADEADGYTPKERPSPAIRSSTSVRDRGRAQTPRSVRTPQIRAPRLARPALRGSDGRATRSGHQDDMHDMEEVDLADETLDVGDKVVAVGNEKVTTGNDKVAVGNRRVAVGSEKVAMVDDEADMGDEQAGMSEDEVNFDEERAGVSAVVKAETSDVESQSKAGRPRITCVLTPKGRTVVMRWPQGATPKEPALGGPEQSAESPTQDDSDVDMGVGNEEGSDCVESPRPKALKAHKRRSARTALSPQKSKGGSVLLASSSKNSDRLLPSPIMDISVRSSPSTINSASGRSALSKTMSVSGRSSASNVMSVSGRSLTSKTRKNDSARSVSSSKNKSDSGRLSSSSKRGISGRLLASKRSNSDHSSPSVMGVSIRSSAAKKTKGVNVRSSASTPKTKKSDSGPLSSSTIRGRLRSSFTNNSGRSSTLKKKKGNTGSSLLSLKKKKGNTSRLHSSSKKTKDDTGCSLSSPKKKKGNIGRVLLSSKNKGTNARSPSPKEKKKVLAVRRDVSSQSKGTNTRSPSLEEKKMMMAMYRDVPSSRGDSPSLEALGDGVGNDDDFASASSGNSQPSGSEAKILDSGGVATAADSSSTSSNSASNLEIAPTNNRSSNSRAKAPSGTAVAAAYASKALSQYESNLEQAPTNNSSNSRSSNSRAKAPSGVAVVVADASKALSQYESNLEHAPSNNSSNSRSSDSVVKAPSGGAVSAADASNASNALSQYDSNLEQASANSNSRSSDSNAMAPSDGVSGADALNAPSSYASNPNALPANSSNRLSSDSEPSGLAEAAGASSAPSRYNSNTEAASTNSSSNTVRSSKLKAKGATGAVAATDASSLEAMSSKNSNSRSSDCSAVAPSGVAEMVDASNESSNPEVSSSNIISNRSADSVATAPSGAVEVAAVSNASSISNSSTGSSDSSATAPSRVAEVAGASNASSNFEKQEVSDTGTVSASAAGDRGSVLQVFIERDGETEHETDLDADEFASKTLAEFREIFAESNVLEDFLFVVFDGYAVPSDQEHILCVCDVLPRLIIRARNGGSHGPGMHQPDNSPIPEVDDGSGHRSPSSIKMGTSLSDKTLADALQDAPWKRAGGSRFEDASVAASTASTPASPVSTPASTASTPAPPASAPAPPASTLTPRSRGDDAALEASSPYYAPGGGVEALPASSSGGGGVLSGDFSPPSGENGLTAASPGLCGGSSFTGAASPSLNTSRGLASASSATSCGSGIARASSEAMKSPSASDDVSASTGASLMEHPSDSRSGDGIRSDSRSGNEIRSEIDGTLADDQSVSASSSCSSLASYIESDTEVDSSLPPGTPGDDVVWDWAEMRHPDDSSKVLETSNGEPIVYWWQRGAYTGDDSVVWEKPTSGTIADASSEPPSSDTESGAVGTSTAATAVHIAAGTPAAALTTPLPATPMKPAAASFADRSATTHMTPSVTTHATTPTATPGVPPTAFAEVPPATSLSGSNFSRGNAQDAIKWTQATLLSLSSSGTGLSALAQSKPSLSVAMSDPFQAHMQAPGAGFSLSSLDLSRNDVDDVDMGNVENDTPASASAPQGQYDISSSSSGPTAPTSMGTPVAPTPMVTSAAPTPMVTSAAPTPLVTPSSSTPMSTQDLPSGTNFDIDGDANMAQEPTVGNPTFGARQLSHSVLGKAFSLNTSPASQQPRRGFGNAFSNNSGLELASQQPRGGLDNRFSLTDGRLQSSRTASLDMSSNSRSGSNDISRQSFGSSLLSQPLNTDMFRQPSGNASLHRYQRRGPSNPPPPTGLFSMASLTGHSSQMPNQGTNGAGSSTEVLQADTTMVPAASFEDANARPAPTSHTGASGARASFASAPVGEGQSPNFGGVVQPLRPFSLTPSSVTKAALQVSASASASSSVTVRSVLPSSSASSVQEAASSSRSSISSEAAVSSSSRASSSSCSSVPPSSSPPSSSPPTSVPPTSAPSTAAPPTSTPSSLAPRISAPPLISTPSTFAPPTPAPSFSAPSTSAPPTAASSSSAPPNSTPSFSAPPTAASSSSAPPSSAPPSFTSPISAPPTAASSFFAPPSSMPPSSARPNFASSSSAPTSSMPPSSVPSNSTPPSAATASAPTSSSSSRGADTSSQLPPGAASVSSSSSSSTTSVADSPPNWSGICGVLSAPSQVRAGVDKSSPAVCVLTKWAIVTVEEVRGNRIRISSVRERKTAPDPGQSNPSAPFYWQLQNARECRGWISKSVTRPDNQMVLTIVHDLDATSRAQAKKDLADFLWINLEAANRHCMDADSLEDGFFAAAVSETGEKKPLVACGVIGVDIVELLREARWRVFPFTRDGVRRWRLVSDAKDCDVKARLKARIDRLEPNMAALGRDYSDLYDRFVEHCSEEANQYLGRLEEECSPELKDNIWTNIEDAGMPRLFKVLKQIYIDAQKTHVESRRSAIPEICEQELKWHSSIGDADFVAANTQKALALVDPCQPEIDILDEKLGRAEAVAPDARAYLRDSQRGIPSDDVIGEDDEDDDEDEDVNAPEGF